MATIKLQENQNLFDAAIQEYGSMEGVFELLEANGLNSVASLDQEENVSVYDDLRIEGNSLERDVVEYFVSREKKPATALTTKDFELLDIFKKCEGIGCMEVEEDFIIHPESEDIPLTCIEKLIYGKKKDGVGYMEIENDNKVK